MERYEIKDALLRKIPPQATDVKFVISHWGPSEVKARVYFTMPREWLPEEGSGIFKAKAHRPIRGKRWQVRL